MVSLRKTSYLLLRFLARKILKRYRPQIVAVTGSVGKSTTIEAIYRVLASVKSVRRSFGNYNTEWGVPASIIGARFNGIAKEGLLKITPWGYLRVLWGGIRVAWGPRVNYPAILVLELAADRPGDISYLLSFVEPQVGVVTNVGISHVEFFKDKEQILKEKILVLKMALKNGGVAVFNRDDIPLTKEVMALPGPESKKLSFGAKKESMVRLLVFTEELEKTKVQVQLPGGNLELSLPPGGKGVAYAALVALSCGLVFGIKGELMADGLAAFAKPRHRMEITKLKTLLIIDDSYNAAPQSMESALSYLKSVGGQLRRRTVAILGAMRELGEKSPEAHLQVGHFAAERVDLVIALGEEEARLMAEGARSLSGKKKKSPRVEYLPFSQRDHLLEILKKNDLVLVKASRSLQFEDRVIEFLKENSHRIK